MIPATVTLAIWAVTGLFWIVCAALWIRNALETRNLNRLRSDNERAMGQLNAKMADLMMDMRVALKSVERDRAALSAQTKKELTH